MEQLATAITTIAEARGVAREFRSGGGIAHALRGVDLRIQPGEFVALRGRTGSGKTTLLNIMIGLDNPTQGQVFILEQDLTTLSETERAHLRRESIGKMFQNAHLFPSLTAQENVEIPLRLARVEPGERNRLAFEGVWSYQGENSNGWHWHALWYTHHASSSLMNQQGIWTR
jgi:putative ABC transport system ATP-binding protein